MVTATELEPSKTGDIARLLGLVESERKYYQGIVASIPIGILILAADLSVVSSNRESVKVLGLRLGEALPHSIHSVLPVSVIGQIADVLRTGIPLSNLITPLRSDSGRGVSSRVRIGVRQIRNWEGSLAVEALVTIEDAGGVETGSSQTGVEGALPVAELLDTLDAVVWALELPSKRFLYVNERAQELLGYPGAKWLDAPSFWSDRVHPDDRAWVVSSYERAIDDWSRHSCEFRAVGSNGEVVWMRETARPLVDSDGRLSHLIGVAVDVTQRRVLESQFVQSQRLEAADNIASRAAAGIVNQVVLISDYTQKILGALDPNDPARADLREILAAAERLQALTGQLTSVQRTQLEMVQAVELGELLKSCEPSIRRRLGEFRQVEIKLFAALIAVRVHPAQLEEILGTFAARAARGMPDDGKLTIHCGPSEIVEQMSRPGSMLHPGVYAAIAMEDNGATMDPETRQGLFDSFLPSREEDCLGPDLSRAYRLVRQLGGDIFVAPRVPQGNLIQIFLPRIGETTVPFPAPLP